MVAKLKSLLAIVLCFSFILNSLTEPLVAAQPMRLQAPTAVASACNLYPIALSTKTLQTAKPGDTFANLVNGVQPGNFGWLSWTGDTTVAVLVASLTPPGNSNTYINPNNPADHIVSPQDWVMSKPGVANAAEVRAALDGLKSIDIAVPVWDQAQSSGANTRYRITNFANVRLLSYQLTSPNQITVRFLGYITCGNPGTPTPTATSTVTPTRTSTATATATRGSTVTATKTVTKTPLPTKTATATCTPTPTKTAKPTKTATATPTATATNLPTNTPTATATAIPSVPTSTATASPTAPTAPATDTATATAIAPATDTATATATEPPTITATPSPTATATEQATATATDTPSPTSTTTAIATDTATATSTATTTATATDTATATATTTGTPPTSTPTETPAQPSINGVIAGEVYNDATGLPLAGVTIQLLALNGQTPNPAVASTTSDALGRFYLICAPGAAVLQISKAGFTSAQRAVTVTAGQRTSPFDARLTPLDSIGTALSSLAGGTAQNTLGDVSLVIPPFALANNQTLVLTHLSAQGLVAPLPLGWSPVAVIDLNPSNLTLSVAATLAVTAPVGLPANATITVARWEPASGTWLTQGSATRSANGNQLQFNLTQTGQYAFLLADPAPNSPPSPADGQALSGAQSVALPANLQAQINPSPRILFAQPGVHSQVTAQIAAATAMQSGTPLQIALNERYDFTLGTQLVAPAMVQDFTLYAFPGDEHHLQAAFVASPSRTFDLYLLRLGVINLGAHAPVTIGAPQGTVLTTAGGRATANNGASVTLSSGAAATDLPVLLTPLVQSQVSISLPNTLTFVGGVALELNGRPLNVPARLAIPAPATVTANDQVLIAKIAEVNGASYLVLVATANLQNNELVTTIDPLGNGTLLLPGILTEGSYLFLRASNPVGFIAGAVATSAGQPLAGALVTANTFPIAAVTNSNGQYALAAPAGAASVTALDPQTQDSFNATTNLPSPNSLVNVDFGLVATPPTVLSVNPVDNAVNAPLTTTVSIAFSRQLDKSSVTASTVSVSSSAGPVAGTTSLSPGDRVLVFRSQNLLQPKTTYTVTVAATVKDLNGRPLAAPFVAHFTTVNQLPTTPPPAGAINATIPDASGFSTVTGSQGTAQTDWIVTIHNLKTAANTTVQPDSDGSFSARVPAAKSDRLELVLRDASNNETHIAIPPFQNPDGSTVVGTTGGKVMGQGGVFVTVDTGSLPDGTVVKVEPVTIDQLPLPPPATITNNLPFIGGLKLDLGGVTPTKYMHVGIPAPADAKPDDQVLVVQAITLTNGAHAWTLIDRAHLNNGQFMTESPPFPGVFAQGTIAFLRPTDIIVPGPNRQLETDPQAGSDDVRSTRFDANGSIQVIAPGPDGVLQTAPLTGADDLRQPECMSYIAQDFSFRLNTIIAPYGIPFAYPALGIGRTVMAAYCNQPLDIRVTAPDTGEILLQATQIAPPGRNEIVYPAQRLTNDHDAPSVVSSSLPTELYDDLQEVFIRFSEGMDADSLKQHLVVSDGSGHPVIGTVEVLFQNTAALFRPRAAFRLGEQYTVNLTGVTDFAGNLLMSDPLKFTRTAPGSFGELRNSPEIAAALTKCTATNACNTSGQDVAAYNTTLFIANGIRTMGEQYPDPAHPKRLLVVDTSNPQAPHLIGWHPTSTNPRAIALLHDLSFPYKNAAGVDQRFQGDLLVVTGGGDNISTSALNAELEIYDVTACLHRVPNLANCLDDSLHPLKGLKFLSTNINEVQRLGVPPDPGVAKEVAVLQARIETQQGGQTVRTDTAVAYVVVVPIGLEAIDLTKAFNTDSTKPDRFAIDGLFRGNFYDVAVLKNTVIAAEEPTGAQPRLKVFTASLVPTEEIPLPRAFRLDGGANFVFDIDRDGNRGLAEDVDSDPVTAHDELFDLAVVASGGRSTPDGQGELYVIDLSTQNDLGHQQALVNSDSGAAYPRVISRIPLPGSAFAVCVDPTAKLAYVDVIGRGLALVDLTHLLGVIRGEFSGWAKIDQNQDGLDDRILTIFPNGSNPTQNLKGLACSRATNADNGVTYVNWEQVGPEPLGLFNLQAKSPLSVKTDIDVINNLACDSGDNLEFTLSQPASVTITIENVVIQVAGNLLPGGGSTTAQPVQDIGFPAGTFRLPIPPEQVTGPGEHPFKIHAVFKPTNPLVDQTFDGVIVHEIVKKAALPLGHTMIGGVDLWDGHLSMSSQDLKIPGRGLSLELSRSYSNGGNESDGPIGAGWSYNYDVRLVHDSCGRYIVQGGEGTGNAFTKPHLADPAQIALFSSRLFTVTTNALFLDPQLGYHSTLIEDPTNPAALKFDFFTKAHIRYHFERAAALPGEVYSLRYIEEPNGNRITLNYTADNDAATLDKVTDTSGRSLNLTYHEINRQKRIVHVTADVLNADLNINVDYGYDDIGNLVVVTRTTPYAGFGFNDQRTEHYTYTRKDPSNPNDPTEDEHNLLVYTDPNGHATNYVYYADADTIDGWQPAFLAPKHDIVKAIQQPEQIATTFTYKFSPGPGVPNVRIVSDRRSNVPPTTYTLNNYGATVKVEGPLGKTTSTVWCIDDPLPADCHGKRDVLAVAQVDELGRTHRFEYDALGNTLAETTDFSTITDPHIVAVKNASGQSVTSMTTHYTYDALFSRMTSMTDAEEHTTYSCIDSPLPPPSGSPCVATGGKTGNLLAMIDAEGNKTAYTYYPNGDMLTLTDPRHYVTRYVQYDAFGNPKQVIGPANNTINNLYDERSRLVDTYDTFTHHTHYTYDGLDRKIKEARLDDRGHGGTPQVAQSRYTPNGELLTLTDGLGQVTEYQYDNVNRQKAIIEHGVLQADGSTRDLPPHQFFYDEDSNLVREIDSRGIEQHYTYDHLNRRTETRLFAGPAAGPTDLVVASATYNVIGLKTIETDLHGHTTNFVYDGLYRVVETDLPFTHAFTDTPFTQAKVVVQYDLVSNKVSETDANGHVSTYAYDKIYRMVSRTDAANNTITYGYDAASNKLREENHTTGLVTTYTYDNLNRKLTMVQTVPLDETGAQPATYTTGYAYDDAHNAIIVTNPRSFRTRTEADGLDRVYQTVVDLDQLKLTTTYQYDGNGNVQKQIDPQGNDEDVVYLYDGLNRKIQATYVGAPDDQGQPVVERFFYDADNNQIKYIDKRGIEFGTTYDNLNRPLAQQVKESISNNGSLLTVAAYQYDDAANKVTVTDANNNQTVTQYDSLGRPTIIDDPDPNGVITYAYDGVNRRQETDKKGQKVETDYDAINRPLVVREYDATGALKTTQTTQYQDPQRQIVMSDRRNIQHVKQLDALGRTTSLKTDTVLLEQYTYDGNSNVVTFTDAENHQTTYAYDGANRKISMTEGADAPAIAATTTYAYDNANNLLVAKDGRQHGGAFDVKYTYDARYRKVSETNGEGNTTIYAYDADDNIIRMQEPLGATAVTTYRYDELNKLLAVDETRGGVGGVTRYLYDANRNKIAQQDANGNLVTYQYDNLNRLTDTFEHLAPGALNANSTRTGNPGGDQATALHWHYAYDPNNNQTLIVDALSQQVDLTYDYLDRLVRKAYSHHANPALDFQMQSVTYTYDGNGNVTQIDEAKRVNSTNVTETTTNVYDALNRLVSNTNFDHKTLTYAYDKQGNRTSVTDPDNRTSTYTYDARNRLVTAVTESGTTTYAYWPDDLLKQITYPNGTVADYSDPQAYDKADRLLRIVNRAQGAPANTNTPISTYVYTYDANGNRLTQTESHGAIDSGAAETTTYQYDLLNRLTHVSYGPNGANGDIAYTYDANGNRLTETGADPAAPATHVARAYAYDRVNQLRSVIDQGEPNQSTAYFYDANGNQTAKVVGVVATTTDANGNPQVTVTGGITTTFDYDIRDEIARAQELGGGAITFDYDYNRQRVRKVSASTGETRYLYDDDATLLEYNGALQTTIKYNYGYALLSLTAVNPVSNTRDSQFYLFDGLMSTSDLADAAGNVQVSYKYDAYGSMRRTVGASVNPKQYTGHYYDTETDLHYFGGRYYDDNTGRFLSQDLYLGQADTPPSLHRYLYAYANPLRFVDLNGYEASEANAGQTTYSNGGSTYQRGGYTRRVTTGSEGDDGISSWINAEDLRMGGSDKIGSISELARKAIHDGAQAVGEATQDFVEKHLGELGVSQDTRGTLSAIAATIPATFMEAAGYTAVDIASGAVNKPISLAQDVQNAYQRDGGGWRGLYAASQELNPVYHAMVSISEHADAMSAAYHQEGGGVLGVTAAINTVNPVYHALVSGYEANEAWEKGDTVTAVNKGIEAVNHTMTALAFASGVAEFGAGLLEARSARLAAAEAAEMGTAEAAEMGAAEAAEMGAAETEAAEMSGSAGCPTVANSFAPDTWVMAQTGLVPIADIHVGDHVFAYNQALHTSGFYTVTATLVHVDPVEIILTLDNERIETTPGHPFFTANGEWRAAGNLKIGDQVRRADGSNGIVQAITIVQQPRLMHNLTVAEAHTFFVGADHWLVHNMKKCLTGTPMSPAVKEEAIARNKAANGGVARCEYCGVRTVRAKKSVKGVTPRPNEIQIDHYHPQSLGGQGTLENAVLACRRCNREWSNKVKPPRGNPFIEALLRGFGKGFVQNVK